MTLQNNATTDGSSVITDTINLDLSVSLTRFFNVDTNHHLTDSRNISAAPAGSGST